MPISPEEMKRLETIIGQLSDKDEKEVRAQSQQSLSADNTDTEEGIANTLDLSRAAILTGRFVNKIQETLDTCEQDLTRAPRKSF